MTDKILELEIRLLLVKHGRRKVIETLAHLKSQTIEEIERELSDAEQKPKPKRSPATASDLVNSEIQKRPEISEALRRLASSFEARTFLPQLRDVQRFLERIGTPVRKPKSRAAVMPTLIRALARMEPHELDRLVDEGAEGESDFTLLARAIMGPSRSNPGAGT